MLSAEFLHRSDDGVCAGLQYHWSTLLIGKTSCFLFLRGPGKQISAVKLQSELRIFQQMASENQYYGLICLNEPLLQQFLEARESDRRGWLAADAIGSDFGFG